MPRRIRLPWESSTRFGGRAARQALEYEAYVPDPIADLDPLLPAALVTEMAEAQSALQALEAEPGFTGLEALARQLIRAESIASSRIEGIESARDVMANIDAMEAAIRLADELETLTPAGILRIHERLLAGTDLDRFAGKLREEQNWIGGTSGSPLNAEFVPPPWEMVADLLADLCNFLDREDVPPIIQAAIAHAQFETIHPFVDGNGRVGRALIHTVLRCRGLAPRFVPPVSIILATNGSRYVHGLTSFRDGNVADWCLLFVRTLHAAVDLSARLARDLLALQARWRGAVEAELGRRLRSDSAASRIIAELPARILVDRGIAREITGTSGEAARRAIEQLERVGVLTPVVIGKRRNRVWEAKELNELLNAYEFDVATPTSVQENRRPAPGRRPAR